LRAGRSFEAHEPTRVGIVTERFARSAWKDANPIGQRVHLGVADGALIEIVGVVADSAQASLEKAPYPQFYELASAQAAFPPSRMLVRTVVPPATMLSAVRTAVRRVDPDQPVARLRTLDELVSDTLATRRFNLDLVGSFALVALALSAIGIFGLLAHVVAERTREIGIRMALGAVPGSVVRLMLRRAWLAVAPGIAIGVGAAYLSSSVLRSLVFQVSPTSPAVYAWVATGLGAVAIIAAWIPARRAARVDPMRALRD
jgi:predicted lysophospholipase L1 biosynthesis ABC-type transport system permease subunit